MVLLPRMEMVPRPIPKLINDKISSFRFPISDPKNIKKRGFLVFQKKSFFISLLLASSKGCIYYGDRCAGCGIAIRYTRIVRQHLGTVYFFL